MVISEHRVILLLLCGNILHEHTFISFGYCVTHCSDSGINNKSDFMSPQQSAKAIWVVKRRILQDWAQIPVYVIFNIFNIMSN